MTASKMALVLSGGISLGSYQAGAYWRMHPPCGHRIDWIAGSSIGAINGAIIAGNRPDVRVERLESFWRRLASLLPPPMASAGSGRRAYNRLSALHSRAFGSRGLYSVRPPFLLGLPGLNSVYDLTPLRGALEEFVDFRLLNEATPRLSVTATDIETGEAVVFDSAKGHRIGPEHLVASCGFLPEFQAIEIDGRLLGDGGLVANAPVDTILGADAPDEDLVCFVLDLFARDAERPESIEDAAARRLDLLFSNQTHRTLDGIAREHRLRRLLSKAVGRLPSEERGSADFASAVEAARNSRLQVFHLSYRAGPDEAGPEKQFDFSRATQLERWEAGERDMARALDLMRQSTPGEGMLEMHRIRI